MIRLDDLYDVFGDNVIMPIDYYVPKLNRKRVIKREVRANPYEVRHLTDRTTKEVILFLTNIRTIQQYATDAELEQLNYFQSLTRLSKRGKPFAVRVNPPRFVAPIKLLF